MSDLSVDSITSAEEIAESIDLALAYNVHKVLEREDKILTLKSQEKAIDQEISRLKKELKKNSISPPMNDSKSNKLTELKSIKKEIQLLRTRVDPEFALKQFKRAPKNSNLDKFAKTIFGKPGKELEIGDLPVYTGISATSDSGKTQAGADILSPHHKKQIQEAIRFFSKGINERLGNRK